MWLLSLGQPVPTPSGGLSYAAIAFLVVGLGAVIAAVVSGRFVVPASVHAKVEAEKDFWRDQSLRLYDAIINDYTPALEEAREATASIAAATVQTPQKPPTRRPRNT